MTSRFGLDTNILIYAIDRAAGAKGGLAEAIVRRAARSRRCVLSLQNLGELYQVCVHKRHATPGEAAQRARDYAALFVTAAPALGDVEAALVEAAAGRFAYWDALLLATLGRAGCTTVLSEDMADGAVLAGVAVRNPFAPGWSIDSV
jgi:predicted nucleic acid-binding protein